MNVFTQMQQASGRAWTSVGSWLRRAPMALKNAQLDSLAQRERLEATPMSVRDLQADLATFYSHYEEMVELLCDAAQYGPNEKMSARYDDARKAILRQYPPLRAEIEPFLEADASESGGAMDLHAGQDDAFLRLCTGQTLESQILSDDGQMISRLIRTRTALTLYAEHLRRLAA